MFEKETKVKKEMEFLTHDNAVTKVITKEGHGDVPPTNSRVLVHYVGKLTEDGTVFDSSRSRGVPFEVSGIYMLYNVVCTVYMYIYIYIYVLIVCMHVYVYVYA